MDKSILSRKERKILCDELIDAISSIREIVNKNVPLILEDRNTILVSFSFLESIIPNLEYPRSSAGLNMPTPSKAIEVINDLEGELNRWIEASEHIFTEARKHAPELEKELKRVLD